MKKINLFFIIIFFIFIHIQYGFSQSITYTRIAHSMRPFDSSVFVPVKKGDEITITATGTWNVDTAAVNGVTQNPGFVDADGYIPPPFWNGIPVYFKLMAKINGQIIHIGKNHKFTCPSDGNMIFGHDDPANKCYDNAGILNLTITIVPPPPVPPPPAPGPGKIVGPTIIPEDQSNTWSYCGCLLGAPPKGSWVGGPQINWKSGDGQIGSGVSVSFAYPTPNDGGLRYNITLNGSRQYKWVEAITSGSGVNATVTYVTRYGTASDSAGPYPVKVLDITKPVVKLFVPVKLFGTTGEKLSDYVASGKNPLAIEFDIEDNNPYSFSNSNWHSSNGYSKKWKVILWNSSFSDDHNGNKQLVFFELPLKPSSTKPGVAPTDSKPVSMSAEAHFIVPLDEISFLKRENVPLPLIPLNYANNHSKYSAFGNYELSVEAHDSTGNMDYLGPCSEVIVADNDPPNIYVGIDDKQGTIGSWVKKITSSLPFIDPENTGKVWFPIDVEKRYSKSPYLYDWKEKANGKWLTPEIDAPQAPDTILFNGFNQNFALDWYILGGDGSNNDKAPIRKDVANGITYFIGAVSPPSHDDSKIYDRLPTVNDSSFRLSRELIQEDVEISFNIRMVDNIDGEGGKFLYQINGCSFLSNISADFITPIVQINAGSFKEIVIKTVLKEPTRSPKDKYYLEIVSEDDAQNWSGSIKRNKRILHIEFLVQDQGIIIEDIKKSNRDY
ncbi:hypothetical protein KAJ27_19005 [bacterium]|nr:hypothetical protein [bacterium]